MQSLYSLFMLREGRYLICVLQCAQRGTLAAFGAFSMPFPLLGEDDPAKVPVLAPPAPAPELPLLSTSYSRLAGLGEV